ncbi:MAG: copper chaperone PCu(A)C [Burkholderiales bacterium]|jgi:hypothetical protein|nr:copper chaperone PCu(A)C [Burkholderiales bacterium]MCE1175662.1 copper chaperone PCu(A)C [Burkholderiales bacterium]
MKKLTTARVAALSIVAVVALSACDKKHDMPHKDMAEHTPPVAASPMADMPSEIRMAGDMKVEVQGAWARATVEGQNMGGAFVNLTTDQDATLVGASSSVSDQVELHTMKMDGEKMVMAPVPSIALPANTKVELKPGSLHIMFMGLKAPLKEGQTVTLKLEIKNKAGQSHFLEIQAPVKAVAQQMKS